MFFRIFVRDLYINRGSIMKLFDVYPLFDVNIVKGQGCKVWDDKGQEYLDLYGGHAVISIGHSHPHYINKVVYPPK